VSTYYHRKLPFINFQVVSLPNLRIIDFSYGHTGSTHDSSAWEGTQLKKDHEKYMEGDDFVWADSAYPVCLLRSTSTYTS
jgi:hypothetical protein